MRVVAGSALRAGLTLRSDPPLSMNSRHALDWSRNPAACGSMDPHRGASVALTEIWKMLMLPGDKWLWLMWGTAGAALAMLGPGLWSVDARLYGWKRLDATPPKSNSNSH
jgi:hypothetical protein